MARWPGSWLELALGEDVGDEALLLPLMEAVTVGGDDAGRLLPAMLQRVQPEVGDVRGLGMAVDADDAAHSVKPSRGRR